MVAGQRLMQAASDIFLGWVRVAEGLDGGERDFYVRQLRDWKGSADIEAMVPEGMSDLRRDVRLDAGPGPRALGRRRSPSRPTSARATPSTGRSPTSPSAYADQNERDYAALKAAVADGRLTAQEGL